MPERWFCLDCNIVGALDVHGRCGTCQSTAVTTVERLNVISISSWKRRTHESAKKD